MSKHLEQAKDLVDKKLTFEEVNELVLFIVSERISVSAMAKQINIYLENVGFNGTLRDFLSNGR